MSAPKTLLVVDDDEDIRDTLREVLERAGYNVALAIHGLDALEQLRAGLQPTLIVLDLMMPVMDGHEFAAELRKDSQLTQIPFVVITAAGNPSEKAAALGAIAHLQKPFKTDLLLRTLRQSTATRESSLT